MMIFGLPRKRLFSGEEIYTLNEKILGQSGFGGGAFVAIKALDDLAVHKTNRSRQFIKLRLRQSAANSGRPEIDVAARQQ